MRHTIYDQTENSTSTNDTKITCSERKRQLFGLFSATTWQRLVGGKEQCFKLSFEFRFGRYHTQFMGNGFHKIGRE